MRLILLRFVVGQTMAPALNVEVIRESVLKAVQTLSKDSIPNIRFNAAKSLEILSTVVAEQSGGKELVRDQILPTLNQLKEDSDADVRYFAVKALEKAGAVVDGSCESLSRLWGVCFPDA